MSPFLSSSGLVDVRVSAQEITRLIDLNVALNFCPKRPWTSIHLPTLSRGSMSRPHSAPWMGAGLSEKNGRAIAEYASPPGDATGSPTLKGVQEDSWSKVSVASLPLVWGQHSADVQAFAPEVVVMSDVVYDPAGDSLYCTVVVGCCWVLLDDVGCWDRS